MLVSFWNCVQHILLLPKWKSLSLVMGEMLRSPWLFQCGFLQGLVWCYPHGIQYLHKSTWESVRVKVCILYWYILYCYHLIILHQARNAMKSWSSLEARRISGKASSDYILPRWVAIELQFLQRRWCGISEFSFSEVALEARLAMFWKSV